MAAPLHKGWELPIDGGSCHENDIGKQKSILVLELQNDGLIDVTNIVQSREPNSIIRTKIKYLRTSSIITRSLISASAWAEKNAGGNSEMIDLKKGPEIVDWSSSCHDWLPGLVDVDNKKI